MRPPLSMAVISGNVELVRLLLDRGAMMARVSEKNVFVNIRANLLRNNWFY